MAACTGTRRAAQHARHVPDRLPHYKKRITIMKKAYIKPSIEIMGLSTDNLLNNGSIVNREGENLGNLGYDPSGGEESEDGYVWGD